MNSDNFSDVDPRMGNGAIKVYENDAVDDFPVLKAFQQYIDAEQAKSRKRMLMLCLFFSFIISVVISVFVVLLVYSSSRNQVLNDRLVEYAMKDRERISPAAPQPSQDASALQTLSCKMEALKAAIVEGQKRDESTEAKRTETRNRPTAEAIEIERLKALLAAEKEKAAVERERLRQAELEEYRRKHYPELYERKPVMTERDDRRSRQREMEEADREIEEILKDIKPVEYFEDEDDFEDSPLPNQIKRSRQPIQAENTTLSKEESAPATVRRETKPAEYIKDAAGNTWGIPE